MKNRPGPIPNGLGGTWGLGEAARRTLKVRYATPPAAVPLFVAGVLTVSAEKSWPPSPCRPRARLEKAAGLAPFRDDWHKNRTCPGPLAVC